MEGPIVETIKHLSCAQCDYHKAITIKGEHLKRCVHYCTNFEDNKMFRIGKYPRTPPWCRYNLTQTLEGRVEPSWDNAPEWVEWRTMDKCGRWKFHEREPSRIESMGMWFSRGRIKTITEPHLNWRKTVEKRP